MSDHTVCSMSEADLVKLGLSAANAKLFYEAVHAQLAPPPERMIRILFSHPPL
jgi:hypothetical protein